jgi:hypothetical protein
MARWAKVGGRDIFWTTSSMTELAAHKQNSVAISPEATAATRLTTDQLALPGRVRTLRQSLLCLEFLRQPSLWLQDPQPTLLIVTAELL